MTTERPAAPVAPPQLVLPRHRRLWPAVHAALPPGELAHDQHHILRVHAWAMRLAPEAGADPDLCGAAALLHDLVVVAKDALDRASASERSARSAAPLLAAAGYSPAEGAEICEAVRTCSWSRGLTPSAPTGCVLQDADRLDATGAIGLMRTAACAQWMSRAGGDADAAFYHPGEPFPASGRTLDDRRYMLDHCYAKLLKLGPAMHLPGARLEAQRRHAALEAFLAELRQEVAPPG